MKYIRLGDLLVKSGTITQAQLEEGNRLLSHIARIKTRIVSAPAALTAGLTAAGWSLGDGSSVDLSRFVDNREVSNYAKDAVGTLVRLGAVNGDERSRLNPRSDITRAEIAVILHFVMTM